MDLSDNQNISRTRDHGNVKRSVKAHFKDRSAFHLAEQPPAAANSLQVPKFAQGE